jgi:hypothetical protein
VAQEIEHLPHKHEVLNLNPSITKTNKKQQQKEIQAGW